MTFPINLGFSRVCLALTSCSALVAFAAQSDWTSVGGDVTQTKYSTLKQITPANVSRLAKVWAWAGGGGEITPLAVDGVVYYPSGPKVFALAGETGKPIWQVDLSTLIPIKPGEEVNPARPAGFGAGGRGGRGGPATPSNSSQAYLPLGTSAKYGLAYWPGTRETGPRIVMATTGGYLIQLDAKTGALIGNFGPYHGAIDLRLGMMENMNLSDYTPGAVPTIYKNNVIVAPRTSENGRYGTPGDPRMFSLVTGEMLWRFHVVPHPGDPNFGTWGVNGWQDRRGPGSWVPMTVDAANGLVFMSTGNATDQDYGGTRPGDNLYASSIVAIDAEKGNMRWFFQTTHHDIYDWDVNSPPVLIDITDKDGRKREAVAQSTKAGYLFILDRLTGKPLLPVEEKSIPPTDVPGELASPTQPVPVKPGPVSRVSLTRDEVANLSPESHKFCLDIYDRSVQMGEGTPYGMVPSLVFPSSTGGPNTAGVTFDPSSNTIFLNSQSLGTIAMLTPVLSSGQFESLSKSKIPFNDPNGYPCSAPPWGEIMAINAATGDFLWRQPLGEYKELTAKGIPPTGQIPSGGSIVTAGGVLFVGSTPDKVFRALDPKTGKLLWSAELPGAGAATPLTFQGKSGKQYVGIVTNAGASGDLPPAGGGAGQLVVFALP
jgi:quinoprotein glucose dehydrogenase